MTESELRQKVHAAQNLSILKLVLSSTRAEIIPMLAEEFNMFEGIKGSLRTITITNSNICSKGAQIIAKLIAESNLTKVKILCCDIEVIDLITILDAIKQSTVLKLKLSEYHIDSSIADTIIGCFITSSLTNLCFDACTFQNCVMVSIIDCIKRSHIKTFSLCNINLNSPIANAIINCIATSSLIKLGFRGCSFVENTAGAIMKAIEHTQLRSLDLGFEQGIVVSELCHLLENSSLTKLNLSGSASLSHLGAITQSLCQSQIHTIDLSHARINDEIMIHICHLLEHASQLKKISLEHCCLTGANIRAICGSIKQSRIVALSLKSNHINHNVALIICNLLKEHKLTKLNLSQCCLSNNIEYTMLHAIRKSSLVQLNIDDNLYLHNIIRDNIYAEVQHNVNRKFCIMKSARGATIQ